MPYYSSALLVSFPWFPANNSSVLIELKKSCRASLPAARHPQDPKVLHGARQSVEGSRRTILEWEHLLPKGDWLWVTIEAQRDITCIFAAESTISKIQHVLCSKHRHRIIPSHATQRRVVGSRSTAGSASVEEGGCAQQQQSLRSSQEINDGHVQQQHSQHRDHERRHDR